MLLKTNSLVYCFSIMDKYFYLNSKIIALIVCSILLLPNASAEWVPLNKNSDSETGASNKTILALEEFQKIPELEPYFNQANGYAVFPSVLKGGFGIGGARGKGEVLQNGIAIGSTSLTQFSVGYQIGGQAFSQIIFFKEKRDTDRFTEGNFEFGAQASAVLIKQGVTVETAYSDGIAVFTIAKGGLMYEASIGGQKFGFDAYD